MLKAFWASLRFDMGQAVFLFFHPWQWREHQLVPRNPNAQFFVNVSAGYRGAFGGIEPWNEYPGDWVDGSSLPIVEFGPICFVAAE